MSNALGFLYEDKLDIEKSMSYFLNALKYAEINEDLYLIAMVLNNIGLAKMKQKQYDSGLKDLVKGLEYMQDLSNPVLKFYLLNNIGIIYNTQKRWRRSLKNVN